MPHVTWDAETETNSTIVRALQAKAEATKKSPKLFDRDGSLSEVGIELLTRPLSKQSSGVPTIYSHVIPQTILSSIFVKPKMKLDGPK